MRASLKIKKILTHVFWSLFGAGVVVLLAAAVRAKQDKECAGVEIEFTGEGSPLFLDKKEVENILTGNGKNELKGDVLRAFDLQQMEEKLEKKSCVEDAEIYFNNQQVLQVKIRERVPVARVFTQQGYSFFLDSSGHKLPLQHKHALRLPVFTAYPFQEQHVAREEVPVLRDILSISKNIARDSFLMALISNIDYVGKGQFELTPILGDLVIEWGDGSDTEEKCKRVKRFYSTVISIEGLDRYERIKVQFKGQVVGVRREEKEIASDQLSASRKIKDVIAELQNEHKRDAEKATLTVIEDAIEQGKNEKPKAGGAVKKE